MVAHRPTIRAHVRHWKRKFETWWLDFFWWLVRLSWPLLVSFLRHKVRGAQNGPALDGGPIPGELFLAVATGSGATHIDVDSLGLDWLAEISGNRSSVAVSEFAELVRAGSDTRVVALSASFLWRFSRTSAPVRSTLQAISFARALRSKNACAWVLYPDSFVIEDSFFGNLFISICGGKSVMLQNTVSESNRWGNLNSTGPHFWTWPKKQLRKFLADPDPEKKTGNILIAATGDRRRRAYMSKAMELVSAAGHTVVGTDYSLPWDDYVELVRSARAVVTSNWTQEWYLSGPQYLKKRVAESLTTQRCWEAFAAGALLVANSTGVLAELEFVPNVHYRELPESPADLADILSESSRNEGIAQLGQEHFLKIIGSSAFPSRSPAG